MGGEAADGGEVSDTAVVSGEPLAPGESSNEFREGQLVGCGGGDARGAESSGQLAGRGIPFTLPCDDEGGVDETALVQVPDGGEPAVGRPDFPGAAAPRVQGEDAAAGGSREMDRHDAGWSGEGVGQLDPCGAVRLHEPWSREHLPDAAVVNSLPGGAVGVGEPGDGEVACADP